MALGLLSPWCRMAQDIPKGESLSGVVTAAPIFILASLLLLSYPGLTPGSCHHSPAQMWAERGALC